MNSFADLFAPLALLLSLQPVGEAAEDAVSLTPEPEEQLRETKPVGAQRIDWLAFRSFDMRPHQGQVRIEQRVIVRISPRSRSPRQDLMSLAPQQSTLRKYEERKMEKCVPVRSIAGVQATRDNKLLLFLNDRRVVAANLLKSCSARDFYSGFYLERSDDGMLCVSRDKLQSRAGSTCEVKRMRQLVVAKK